MIHAGQVGAIIRLTSSFDLSTATALSIRYRKPSGDVGSWIGTLSGTTAVQYTTAAEADLDESGSWTFQGYATFGDGSTIYSTEVTDRIGKVLTVA